MRQRGRPSTSNATPTVIDGGFTLKPPAPDDLAPEAASIWRAVVDSEPQEFLRTGAQRDLLKDYCRHRATADKVSTVIDLFETEWLKSKDGIKRYADLCKVRDAEGRAAADKATKLRLTNQSRWQPQGAARAADKTLAGPKPWEI